TVSDRDIYLARYGDYTMSASRQTVRGDPPVLMPFAEDLARARAKALEARFSPQREEAKRGAEHARTLRESMTDMKARELARRVQRNYEALERHLLAAEAVQSRASAAADGSPAEGGR